MLQLRREQRRGQDWLGPELGVPARTVSAILRRHGVAYLRECDPLTGELIRASKTTAVRYEHDYPGSLVHMDVKTVGRIHDGGGWRAHGREHGQTGAQERARIGFDYIHSLVDDHSRIAYSEVLADEKGSSCAQFLLRAADYFAGHGIPRIERVMTDNHLSYKRSGDVAAAMTALGAAHVFIRAHCPWQNGKVERYNFADYSEATTKSTTAAGASVTATVTVPAGNVSHVGLVMAKGPTRGSAKVYVDGILKATVNTYATSAQSRVIVFERSIPAGTHRVKVVNVATPGHPRIDLDAVLTN